MRNLSRRQFVIMASAAAAGTAVAPMGLLNARRANAQASCFPASFSTTGFGPIAPRLPENTSALGNIVGTGDLRNVPMLSLPDGFKYTAISIKGDIMTDGNIVPGDHDGMACFAGRRGEMILVRNHELSADEDEDGNLNGCLAANGKQYDPFTGPATGLGGGGTTNVRVDRKGRLVEDFVSLGGTIRNCAGGPTYWNSWISCEENVSVPGDSDVATVKHGYNFEVPASLSEAVDPIPLIAMGRMNHEAVSTDKNGYIYETEDRGDSCYYRFVPKGGRPSKFGDLQKGGRLYAMVIKKNQRSDCNGAPLPTTITERGDEVVDTRGLARGASASFLPFLGQPLKVEWVRLDDVDPAEDTLRYEAQAKGGSLFWRGEGAWYDRKTGKHYWVNSGAGDAGEGQVMCYDPKFETVTLVVESTTENLLDGPDNIAVGPDGLLYLCEDGSSGDVGAPNFGQRVVVVDRNGGLFDFAFNLLDTGEFAGACFSPNGKYMFVNSQSVGVTYAIWRPGQKIALYNNDLR